MKKTTKKIIQLSKKCPECGLDIKGYAESQVEYNLKLHLDSHQRKTEDTQLKQTEESLPIQNLNNKEVKQT